MKKRTNYLIIIAIFLATQVAYFGLVRASFIEPTVPPYVAGGGGVIPIDEGPAAQIKTGNFSVGSLSVLGGNFFGFQVPGTLSFGSNTFINFPQQAMLSVTNGQTSFSSYEDGQTGNLVLNGGLFKMSGDVMVGSLTLPPQGDVCGIAQTGGATTNQCDNNGSFNDSAVGVYNQFSSGNGCAAGYTMVRILGGFTDSGQPGVVYTCIKQ
jgi:hypothetical protein